MDKGIKKPKIAVVCGDPGGAVAVRPVLDLLLQENRIQIKPIAYNEAAVLWRECGVSHIEVPNDYPLSKIRAQMSNYRPNLLFTGTSVNSFDLEKKYIAIASELGIPSLSLLDFWTNYTWRFSDPDGDLVFLPDKIAIMDHYAYEEMVQEGFDPTKLVITGQPVFDDLAAWRKDFSAKRTKEVRKNLGLQEDECFVLFASQPLTSLYGTDKLEEKYLGFDEWTVLSLLIENLESIKRETNVNIHLVIRPHPRESAELFMDYQSDSMPITVVRTGSARSQVMAADLVIGMNTELLVEACYLGCIVVSLQPGLRHPDRLPTNRLGFSRAVYNPEDIKPVLTELMLDQSARQRMLKIVNKFQLTGKSAGNVVQLIYDMVNLT